MKHEFDLSLYLVTDRPLSQGRDMEWIVEEAVSGGATIVQLREKECSTGEFVQLAQNLKKCLSQYGIPLIINDRIDVALAIDADGVHIGQSDMPYSMARRLLGKDKIIGLSVETLDEVRAAEALDVDYIAISPVYSTNTKTDTSRPFMLSGLEKAMRLTTHRVVAIGGMNSDTIAPVMKRGIEGVAVVSAIVSARSPKMAAAELCKIVNDNRATWSSVAWNAVSERFEAMASHPFNVEMAAGTLSAERFTGYLQQDIIYIANYAREMELLAGMMPDAEMRTLFATLASEGMESEKALHRVLSERLGGISQVRASEVTERYMAYTRKYIESGNVALALAAVLPCLWVYNELGKVLQGCCTKHDNPYYEWIETYSSPQMSNFVEKAVAMADSLAASATAAERAAMLRVFAGAVQLELEFFDYGYNGGL